MLPISPLTKRKKANSKTISGFTLIELLVVVGLIAIIGAFAVPAISNYFKISLNSITRNLATTIRETYNATAITGRVHRIVYDLKSNEYWVEGGPRTVLLDTDASREIDERKKRFQSLADEEKNKKKTSPFQIEKSITAKKTPLPRGVQFDSIITEQSKDPITAGQAFTHFFPHGLTEQTLIRLKDADNHKTTLIISPLTGKTRVVNYFATKEEILSGAE